MFFRVINGFRALFLGVLLLACLASFAAVGVAWWNVLGVLLLGYYTVSNAVAAFGRSGGQAAARPVQVAGPLARAEHGTTVGPVAHNLVDQGSDAHGSVAHGSVAQEGDVPPGWYWAPFDSATERRWWDGTNWTERTDPQTTGRASVDLATAEPPALKRR